MSVIWGALQYCSDEQVEGAYVQSETEVMQQIEDLKHLCKYSEILLDVMEEKSGK